MRLKHCIMMALGISVAVALVWLVLPVQAAENATPNTYIVTLYKTELSSDYGASWLSVFTDAAGKSIDLKSANAGSAFGSGAIPAGTYNALRFTIKNSIEYSWPATIPAGTIFSPYPGAADLQVPVYFSISGTFAWSNDGSTMAKAFPMPDPIKVVANATSKVILNFGITNSLVKVGANWYLEPPTITVTNVVIQTTPPPGGAFTGGDYYYIRQNIRLPADAELTITPTWLAMESGWGKITLTPSANPDVGTFTILSGDDNTHGRWIANNGLDMGGQIESGTGTITGKYYVDADGYINMLMPQTDGIIRGAIRSDKKVFVAIEISSPSSQSANTWVSYHMIYCIKKEDHLIGPLTGDYLYNGYNSMFASAIDDLGANRSDHYQLNYDLGIGYFKGETNQGTSYETTNGIEINQPLSPTAQQVSGQTVTYYGPGVGDPIMVTANGTWDSTTMNTMNLWGASLADDTISIVAGAITAPSETWSYTDGPRTITNTGNIIQFFLAVKPAPAGTWNISNVAGTYSFAYKGDFWENSMGNKLSNNWVMLGRFTLDGAGNVSGRSTRSELGVVEIEDLSGIQYTVIKEWVGATPTAPSAIQVDVIKLTNSSDPDWSIKLLISSDGKCLVPYAPPGDPATSSSWNKERGLGLAVKQ